MSGLSRLLSTLKASSPGTWKRRNSIPIRLSPANERRVRAANGAGSSVEAITKSRGSLGVLQQRSHACRRVLRIIGVGRKQDGDRVFTSRRCGVGGGILHRV